MVEDPEREAPRNTAATVTAISRRTALPTEPGSSVNLWKGLESGFGTFENIVRGVSHAGMRVREAYGSPRLASWAAFSRARWSAWMGTVAAAASRKVTAIRTNAIGRPWASPTVPMISP